MRHARHRTLTMTDLLTRKELERRLEEWDDRREHCPECHGTGHPFVDYGNELSGYDYRFECECQGPPTSEEEALETALWLVEQLAEALSWVGARPMPEAEAWLEGSDDDR